MASARVRVFNLFLQTKKRKKHDRKDLRNAKHTIAYQEDWR